MTIPTVTTLTTSVTFQLNKHLRVTYLWFLSLVTLSCALLIFHLTIKAQPENPLPPLSDVVVSKLKTIAMIGEVRANNRYVFAKVGDSITVSDRFLYAIGNGTYQLGDYAYLQPVCKPLSARAILSTTRRLLRWLVGRPLVRFHPALLIHTSVRWASLRWSASIASFNLQSLSSCSAPMTQAIALTMNIATTCKPSLSARWKGALFRF
jgi:hypothetical protein